MLDGLCCSPTYALTAMKCSRRIIVLAGSSHCLDAFLLCFVYAELGDDVPGRRGARGALQLRRVTYERDRQEDGKEVRCYAVAYQRDELL